MQRMFQAVHKRNLILQQPLLTWAQVLKAYLNRIFLNRWIGCGGPISWLPRYPDIIEDHQGRFMPHIKGDSWRWRTSCINKHCNCYCGYGNPTVDMAGTRLSEGYTQGY